MVFLISLAVAAVFALTCDKALKKHAGIFYIGAAVVSLFFVIFEFPNASPFVKNYVLAVFQKGTLATAIFVIVMFTGALKNGSALIKKLMPVRAELSIIASILILIHGFGYGKIYIVRLFTSFGSMPALQVAFVIFSIIMLAIMIPLAVISFKKIRKKMNAKRWKQIQRAAYVFYGLIYLHVMLIYFPSAQKGNAKNIVNIIVYSVVFITYAAMRIRKAVLKKNKTAAKKITISSASAGAAAMLAVCALVLVPYAQSLSNIEEPVAHAEKSDSTNDTNITKNDIAPQATADIAESNSSSAKISSENTVSNAGENSDSSKKSSEKSTDTSSEKNNSSKKTESKKSSDTSSANSNTASQTTSSENNQSETQSQSGSEQGNSNNNTTQNDNNNNNNNDNNNNQQVNSEQSNEQNNQSSQEPAAESPIEQITVEEPVEEPQTTYIDGEYEAKRYAYDGYVYVKIVVENDRIVSIEANSDESDTWYFEQADSELRQKIIDEQRTDLDAVSGATFSSNGLLGAVEDALKKALRNP